LNGHLIDSTLFAWYIRMLFRYNKRRFNHILTETNVLNYVLGHNFCIKICMYRWYTTLIHDFGKWLIAASSSPEWSLLQRRGKYSVTSRENVMSCAYRHIWSNKETQRALDNAWLAIFTRDRFLFSLWSVNWKVKRKKNKKKKAIQKEMSLRVQRQWYRLHG
jgi:hypothetical protein